MLRETLIASEKIKVSPIWVGRCEVKKASIGYWIIGRVGTRVYCQSWRLTQGSAVAAMEHIKKSTYQKALVAMENDDSPA